MKHLSKSIALALTLFTVTATFNGAMADSKSGANANVSGRVGAPAGISIPDIPILDVAKTLFFRLHSVGIDNHIKEMKRDGVTERKFVAGVTLAGAIVYDHEFKGKGLLPETVAGRNAGFQLIPYKLKLDNDFNVCKDYWDNPKLCGWHFIDNFEILSFEYNNDIARGIKQKE